MALVALGGSVELTGAGGTRRVAADDFFAGFFETALEPGELLTAVRVPRRPGMAWGYQKFVRRANDWAIVGAAAIDGRIALANMGSVPLRARAAEQALADGASAARGGRARRRGDLAWRGYSRRPGVPPAPRARAHPAGTRASFLNGAHGAGVCGVHQLPHPAGHPANAAFTFQWVVKK